MKEGDRVRETDMGVDRVGRASKMSKVCARPVRISSLFLSLRIVEAAESALAARGDLSEVEADLGRAAGELAAIDMRLGIGREGPEKTEARRERMKNTAMVEERK